MSSENNAELLEKIMHFEKFVARRFDELSAEINATSQQIDMTEETIAGRFTDIVGALHSITHTESSGAVSAANTGVELEDVVDMTEEAANRILDAAGRIGSFISNDTTNWDDPDMRVLALDAIKAQVEEIFLACSFQDLTGQRIRETLNNLRALEGRLNNALDRIGIHVDPKDVSNSATAQTTAAQSQDEIDALFSGENK